MRDDYYRTALGQIGAFMFGMTVVGTLTVLICTGVAIDHHRQLARARWLGQGRSR